MEQKRKRSSSSLQPPASSFKRRGFTLIEIMLVVIIIGALAAMVVPRLAGRSEEARRQVAAADIKGNVALALRLYEVDNGRYPTTEQSLTALLTKPTAPPPPSNWRGPYLEQEPLDPWKQAYQYRHPGTHPPLDYDLYSLGPDGKESEDDITNWQQKETR
ncbi:MAG: type II secretion system major pseudopilin GspG [Candidatus Omnitrophica bacterium]|nr:type II secretion system major pseudopilin GspG [Candidatus Omnitrophota bacterium]